MRFQMRLKSLLLLILWVSLIGCGGVAGEFGLQSVEKDKQYGKEAAKTVAIQMGVVDDPKLTSYLSRIGARLVSKVPNRRFDYQFAIVDTPEPNAFAVPGGYIYVSRGLLALVNSEDELANILAHEIIHVSRRHSAQQLARQRLPNLLQLPGAVVGGIIGGPIGDTIQLPFAALSASYLASHSRDHELEADELGVNLAGQSGYAPNSLATILGRLEKEDKLRTGKDMRPDFFSTHPATPKRVESLAQISRRIQWTRNPGISGNRSDFLGLLNDLLVGPNPAAGVFVKEKFLHPVLGLYLAFPKGWMTANNGFAIGGIAPTKDGVLVLGPPKKGDDPEKVGKRFAQAMYQRHRLKPNRARSLDVNGRRAFLLYYRVPSSSGPSFLNFLWVKDQAGIFPLFGMAKKSQIEKLRRAALSFRSLKPSERALIKEARLRIVTAREGESLVQLRKRTKSAWDAKTLAVFNGLSTNQILRKGQLIKVSVSVPYRSKTN